MSGRVTQIRRGRAVQVAKGIRGHAITYNFGQQRYECTCGVRLDGGPYGDGRTGARDVMRFHRLDVAMDLAPDHPYCPHRWTVRVTSHEDIVNARGPHASTLCCDGDKCRTEASAWVESVTGRKALVVPLRSGYGGPVAAGSR